MHACVGSNPFLLPSIACLVCGVAPKERVDTAARNTHALSVQWEGARIVHLGWSDQELLVVVTQNASVHLWDVRGPTPTFVREFSMGQVRALPSFHTHLRPPVHVRCVIESALLTVCVGKASWWRRWWR